MSKKVHLIDISIVKSKQNVQESAFNRHFNS